MKLDFIMQLHDNEKNRKKAEVMGVIDIMFDDMDNAVPDKWYIINGDAGIDVPWGTKYKITIEVLG